MKPEIILYAMNDIDNAFLAEARTKTTSHRHNRKLIALVAAVITLMALTATAFAAEEIAGWFKQYFARRSDTPLTPGQIEFIEENEQVISETQTTNDWTVELKSTICDGKTGYVVFGITAPEGIRPGDSVGNQDDSRIIPGNSGIKSTGEELVRASVPLFSKEQNYSWSLSHGFEEDGDGKDNTIDYVFQLQLKKLYNDRPMMLDNPFRTEFCFCFDKFVRVYQDMEYKQELLNTKYRGQTEYMLEPEEVQRLYQTETLTEGLWEFTVTFADAQPDTLELISEPIYTEGLAFVEFESDALITGLKREIMDIKITSFKLTGLGATITCDFEGSVIDALFEHRGLYGYKDRIIFVVMKDGTHIALHTDGPSYNLSAESPIILSEVDYVLLADGTKLTVP